MTTSYFQTANELKQKGQFSEALAYYYQAIEQNPKFHLYHHSLGETLAKLGCFEEAIASFQQAIDISPNGSSYYGMAQSYTQLGNINRANLAYYRAIELNPNWGVVLVKQGGLDRVIACFDFVLQREPHQAMVYYDFSLYLAERDLMDDAIKCFQKAPQFSHNQELNNKRDQEKFPETVEISEILWKNLNQLGKIDDISEPIPTKSEAEAYFEKNSNYTIIDINNLTEADQSLLTNYGISLANLQLIRKDDINLEEIYINSFHPTSKIKLSRKFVEDIRNLWKPRKNHACCKAMVETSYIYSICPLSGKIIRSNQSFIAHYNHWRALTIKHVYRLDGKEVFYLVIDTFCMGKMCIYMPEKELIITWSNDCEILTKTINALKTNLVTSYHKVQNYIQTELPKNIVFDIGFNKNFGHHYWNELSGILYLQHNSLLEKIPEFLVGDKDFFNVGGVFPEIPSDKITKLANTDELFQTILDNNYFAVQVNDLFMSQELADRVTQFSRKKCSENPEFLQEVEMAKKHFPLLCIHIRSRRTWGSQVEGNANIIKKLAEEFPNLGVVFDGWARQEVEDSWADSMIAEEKDIMNQIIYLVPSNIQTYCLIGSRNYEKVVFTNEVDLYCIPGGSGITKVQWIANKPGVVHAQTVAHGVDWVEEHWGSPLVRENIIPVRLVPREYMVDLPNGDYDCNWSAVYEQVVKIARELSPRNL
ncbi:tetratricopeptide repeat protein [Planktothrix agardhii]|uniref:tetratricopeptide repeat protein n=1 Tax=Planktothrix agardhii TaxID=1160 RepID=UPI001D09E014|nr:tetratricopeptide repeat protein [Planktothrix agardhii]MCB8785458.1 tetratricopeptide repeat protein [Planktothrix agardhii 1025]MCF3612822.1 tetratricopeptide repeat protein [Planktothrix agardhii 1027]CAD5942477.1 Small glutamine-rich tetratricopeptide repeat-containing protein [Planktothrix agardhii]